MSVVYKYPSINCAAAHINGETPLSVRLNYPDKLGIYPIHHAARSCWPNITKLFLQHGARLDLPCGAVHPLLKRKLPYQLTLERLARMRRLNFWVPEYCPFNLVLELCQPRRQEAFQTIGLLGFGKKRLKNNFFIL